MAEAEGGSKKGISIAVAVVLIIAAGVIAYTTLTGDDGVAESGPADAVYFFDVGSGELFPVAGDPDGPLPAPSGATLDISDDPAGVRAYVFACGSCDDPASRFIAYVEMFPPEHRGRRHDLRNPALALMAKAEQGQTDLDWVEAGSPQGQQIREELADRCPGGTMVECFPEQQQ